MRWTNAAAVLAAIGLLVPGCGKDASGPDVEAPVLTVLSPVQGTVGTEVRIDGSPIGKRP